MDENLLKYYIAYLFRRLDYIETIILPIISEEDYIENIILPIISEDKIILKIIYCLSFQKTY